LTQIRSGLCGSEVEIVCLRLHPEPDSLEKATVPDEIAMFPVLRNEERRVHSERIALVSQDGHWGPNQMAFQCPFSSRQRHSMSTFFEKTEPFGNIPLQNGPRRPCIDLRDDRDYCCV
jgi:hypothetical protein